MGKTTEKNENEEYSKGSFVDTCDKNVKTILSEMFDIDLSPDFEDVSRLVEITMPRILWESMDTVYPDQAKTDCLIREGLYKILFAPTHRKTMCIQLALMIKIREEKKCL